MPGGRGPPSSPIPAWRASSERAGFGDIEAAPGSGCADPGLVLGGRDRRPRARLAAAVRPRRWTWPAARAGHAGGAAEPSTTRSPRPSHGRSARPDEEALAWEGEDGAVRRLTWSELDRAARVAAAASRRPRDRRGQPGRDLPADAARDGHRGPRPGPPPGRLHADLHRLRGAGRGRPARGVRGDPPDHRRRLLPRGALSCRSKASPTRRSPSRRRSGG